MMTEQAQNEKKTKRSEAQRNAELRHEQHRLHFKLSANLKTNPAYARKFQRYQEANLLGTLLKQAILNAPDNPEDFVAYQFND